MEMKCRRSWSETFPNEGRIHEKRGHWVKGGVKIKSFDLKLANELVIEVFLSNSIFHNIYNQAWNSESFSLSRLPPSRSRKSNNYNKQL